VLGCRVSLGRLYCVIDAFNFSSAGVPSAASTPSSQVDSCSGAPPSQFAATSSAGVSIVPHSVV
jgi:hypothetical protein